VVNDRKWWKEAVVYQCYWRSYFDSNNDGIGDLRGLTAKLDYIKELGVDIIWLNPCFVSPDKDNGYDIADYCAIIPKAGTMADFDELLRETHKRGLKMIMDLVVNHTSNQHQWFLEARSSRDNPKRNWYIWRDPVDNQPPNNYKAYFSPSAWEYDELTGQYYFHSFAIEQPDLNWKNPELRQAIYSMMRFWLDKGVNGFRMDVINMLAKKDGFPNAEQPELLDYMSNNPGVHGYLQEMNREVLSKYDILTVGECPWTNPQNGTLFAGFDRGELNTLFHFECTQEMPVVDWNKFKKIQSKWHRAFFGRAWNSQYLSNHDVPRQVSKYASAGVYRIPAAKMLATLIHMLPGMPYIYQGEEIGMTNVQFETIDEYDDIWMKHRYQEIMTTINCEADQKTAFDELRRNARDNARTPMQWNDEANGGFSTSKPWLAVNPNYTTVNVHADRVAGDSVFRYYQQLIALRKTLVPVIVYGDYREIDCRDERIYAFERFTGSDCIRVILNTSAAEIAMPDGCVGWGEQLCNYGKMSKGTLRPYEVLIVKKIME
jgi:oligo-1,6-glucosidase